MAPFILEGRHYSLIFRVRMVAAFSLELLTIGIYLCYLDAERKLTFKLIVKEWFWVGAY
jgi:hypothetical protein